MAKTARRLWTYEEYLEFEAGSLEKHEFCGGEILAMAGGTPTHAELSARMIAALIQHLRGRPCRTHTSDLRIFVPATGLSTYPDASVVCGPLERAPGDRHAVTNPTVLVEVLSKSTEAYDRGEKFGHYRRLPTLQDYVLVSCRERLVEVFHRGQDGLWLYQAAGPGERATLPSLGATVIVDELYEGVELDSNDQERGG